MSTAEQYRPNYSVDDYLQWEGDWELWDGIPVSMSPAAIPEHQRIATRLTCIAASQLDSNQACDHCTVLAETDWKVDHNTIVRPDVLITCDPLPKKHILQAPTFIAEVLSPSTAHKDRTAKRSLYESNDVRYYAMIDPKAQTIELLTQSENGFVDVDLQSGQAIDLQLTDKCSISIDFSELFSARTS